MHFPGPEFDKLEEFNKSNIFDIKLVWVLGASAEFNN